MILWTVLNIFLLIATVSAEYYTSLILLKTVIGAERNILVMINDYMEKELERLDYLKNFAQEVQEHNDKAISGGDKGIRHPINEFLLIERMITDWNKVVKIMRSNSADDIICNLTRQKAIKLINYPTEEDLLGAVLGLLRLQDTYQMDTKDIADGKILKSQVPMAALNAGDCFEIGRVAYHVCDYYHTIMWMQEARDRLEKEVVPTANLNDILEYLAISLYKQGNLKRALLFTDELCRINPDHPRAKENVREYEDLLENNGIQRIDMRRGIPPINNPRHENELDEGVRLTYEALCRQELPIDTKAQSRLYCYYKMDRPYLRLAPFKLEIVRQNPLIVLIHNIMSDEEARIIQTLAVPKACLVLLVSYYHTPYSFSRARKKVKGDCAWLKSTEHGIVERIDRRLELATNLEIETAEDLQVHNYGTGGYFIPHLDCKGNQRFKKLGTGNRIATTLIYMNEPEIGGRTVFTTNLKISLPCIKNAALFWYNLVRNGEIDMRSRHGACPVLFGTKWIITKWIHERGQEWRRPCGLNQFDQERYIGDLGAPEPKCHSNIRSEVQKSEKMHKNQKEN
uniref:procollagen-proline 4-dioxygenase n=1 Tax=Onchocerca volvulus TaxID=6282 RepID=A0A8R1XNM9_ONCVO